DFEDLPSSPIRRRDRRGIVFIGNFWHPPNREALQFLFEEILPLIDPPLLKKHPIKVIGNKLEEMISHVDPIPPGVELVGWVPSVIQYLERARLSIIPLRTGAGTKRKLIQSLMVGTPTVSTSIGVEGIPIQDETHVLIADDPREFAECMQRLLVDDALWRNVCRRGREVALADHGREPVSQYFAAALTEVFSRPVAPSGAQINLARSVVEADYDRTMEDVQEAVRQVTREGSVVYVISRGDPE